MLHGFTTWSLTTILTFSLLTSAIGGILGGAASLFGKVASVSGDEAKSAGPMLTNLASRATSIAPDEVKQQAGDVVTDPRFQAFASDVLRNGQVSPADRNNLVQLVAQKQGISQQQADAEVTDWQQRIEQAKQQATTTATNMADSAASGVSKAALWSFVALLLGAIAATFGWHDGFAQVRSGTSGVLTGCVAT